MSVVVTDTINSKAAISKKEIIVEIISGLFIILFLYTSISKLSNVFAFKSVLSKSPLIGSFSSILAWAIPFLEIIISVLLIMPRMRKIGLISASLLMILFTTYLAYMIMFTPDLPCSCGGVITYLSWKQHVLFNLFFLVIGITGILLSRKASSFK